MSPADAPWLNPMIPWNGPRDVHISRRASRDLSQPVVSRTSPPPDDHHVLIGTSSPTPIGSSWGASTKTTWCPASSSRVTTGARRVLNTSPFCLLPCSARIRIGPAPRRLPRRAPRSADPSETSRYISWHRLETSHHSTGRRERRHRSGRASVRWRHRALAPGTPRRSSRRSSSSSPRHRSPRARRRRPELRSPSTRAMHARRLRRRSTTPSSTPVPVCARGTARRSPSATPRTPRPRLRSRSRRPAGPEDDGCATNSRASGSVTRRAAA